jgi:DNA polymerase III subunit delta'
VALPELRGHAEVRESLTRLARSGALPQSLLLHGPAGVGKERLGLWIAQLILCEDRDASPCGRCASCRLLSRLEHPDVHWFFPLPRPENTSPDRLRDRLEEHRAAELQLWRAKPLRVVRHEKAPAYFLASIRSLQQLASVRPSLGQHKVFVVGDAELMVPQESSPEAANAFLKLLEEPPPATTLVLTSSQPGALLPTIRSRVLAVRVGSVPEQEIQKLLTEGGLADPDEASSIALGARGSVQRALQLAGSDGAPIALTEQRQAGKRLLLAALATEGATRLTAALDRRPAGIKQEFVEDLDSFSEWLRDLMAVAAGADDRAVDPEALGILRRAVDQRDVSAEGAMRAIERVSEARELALGNVNPQLILADLLKNVQTDLAGHGSSGTPRRG